jgi:hypothetical protein
MRKFLINLLFSLLGNTIARTYNIPYLFGATTITHDGRKKKWEKALVRLWRDKDMLDFLYYQTEADKENIFRGKIPGLLSKGARIRTLFIVHSARLAYEKQIRSKRSRPDEVDESNLEMKEVSKIYRETVDIGTQE